VTDWLEFMVTLQAPVPEQAPDQPVNAEPEVGVAVSVTAVPLAKLAEHVPGQAIPAGVDVIVPLPVPLVDTVSVNP